MLKKALKTQGNTKKKSPVFLVRIPTKFATSTVDLGVFSLSFSTYVVVEEQKLVLKILFLNFRPDFGHF